MERQSALQSCHLQAQATMQSFSAWQLPAWYKNPASELAQVRASVGISDASYLSKLDVRGSFEVSPPARLWKLTPVHALVTSPEPIDFTPSSLLTDVSSVYSAILLAGPRAQQLLQKLTTLNVSDSHLPEGSARQTRLAHVNAIVLRSRGFLLLNTRDVAQHVWETLLHLGAHPFGMVAQQQWMESAREDA